MVGTIVVHFYWWNNKKKVESCEESREFPTISNFLHVSRLVYKLQTKSQTKTVPM